MTFTREDYEMAAMAAGMRIDPGLDGMDAVAIIEGVLRRWNPLTDDGDALRLAIKLGLYLNMPGLEVGYRVDHVTHIERIVLIGDGLEAATRRAIFRAAVAVGRAMS